MPRPRTLDRLRTPHRRWRVLPAAVLLWSGLLPVAAAHADVRGASAAPVIIVVSDTTDGHGWRSLRRAVGLFNPRSGPPGLIVGAPRHHGPAACGAPAHAAANADLAPP